MEYITHTAKFLHSAALYYIVQVHFKIGRKNIHLMHTSLYVEYSSIHEHYS